MDIKRIRRLAGITEARPIDDPDARMARESRISRAIALSFEKINLPVAENGVYYDEEDERTARVTLDDSPIALTALNRLSETQRSEAFLIEAAANALEVIFSVRPDFDHIVGVAKPSP